MRSKLMVMSQVVGVVLVSVPLMGMGRHPPSMNQLVNGMPCPLVYTRPDAGNVHISIRSENASQGGLTSTQLQQVTMILSQLPADHAATLQNIFFVPHSLWVQSSEGQKGVSYANDGDRSIYIDAGIIPGSGMSWLGTLRHEIGHEVEFHAISDTARQAWINLHNQSNNPSDFVSDYAKTSEEEDFAETYRTLSPRTFSDAVKGAGQGHTVLMSKMIFMASQFISSDPSTANYDGTITMYGPDPSGQVLDQPTRVPYQKTNDMLRIGDYTFHLSGQNITSITDSAGNTIASGLSVPLVPPFWPKIAQTVVSPTNSTPASVIPAPVVPTPVLPQPFRPVSPTMQIIDAPDSSGGTGDSIQTVEVVSQEAPSAYRSLLTSSGAQDRAAIVDLANSLPNDKDTYADIQRKAAITHPVGFTTR